MSRLLVCPPDYFQIDYEINPWMRRENGVDPARAVRQWQALMTVLEQDVGVGVERMQPVQGLPDLVFTACLLYTSPSPRDRTRSRMPSSACKKKHNNTHNNTHTHIL